MIRQRIILVILLSSVALAAHGIGIGLDAQFSADSVTLTETDEPFLVTELDAVAVVALPLGEAELAPFLGLSFEQQRDADLTDPVIDRQFGILFGAGYFIPVLQGDTLRISAGPNAAFTWLLQPAASAATSYVNIGADVSLLLNLDLVLGARWSLRIGVDTVGLGFDYDVRDEQVDVAFALDTVVLRNAATVGVRFHL